MTLLSFLSLSFQVAMLTEHSAWMPNTDLQPLSPEDCQDVPEKGKSKSLIEAYKIAAESHDLSYIKEILLDHQEQIAEDQQRVKEREEKKAAKAKRKSDAAAAVEEVDEMDVDEDEEEDKPKSKKRKKAAESDDEGKVSTRVPTLWFSDILIARQDSQDRHQA